MPRSQVALGRTVVSASIASTLLWGITAVTALEIMGIVSRNIAGNPSELLMRLFRGRVGRVAGVLGGIRGRLRRGVILAVVGRMSVLVLSHGERLSLTVERMISQAKVGQRVGPNRRSWRNKSRDCGDEATDCVSYEAAEQALTGLLVRVEGGSSSTTHPGVRWCAQSETVTESGRCGEWHAAGVPRLLLELSGRKMENQRRI